MIAVAVIGSIVSRITALKLMDEVYDDGEIIFQESFEVLPDDTPDLIAERIHVLEHKNYPVVIDLVEIPEHARWGMTVFVDIDTNQ